MRSHPRTQALFRTYTEEEMSLETRLAVSSMAKLAFWAARVYYLQFLRCGPSVWATDIDDSPMAPSTSTLLRSGGKVIGVKWYTEVIGTVRRSISSPAPKVISLHTAVCAQQRCIIQNKIRGLQTKSQERFQLAVWLKYSGSISRRHARFQV